MRLLKIIGSLLIIVSAFIFIYIFRLSYDAFIALVLKITHYAKPEKITGILTPGKYRIIQLLPLTGVAIGGFLLIFRSILARTFTEVGKWIKGYLSSFNKSLQHLTKEEIICLSILLLINICIKGYLAARFPITYDEAWTYINFTQKGIVSSISYYPAPNNHIFYSLLTNLFSIIPLSHQLIVRLPALLANTFFILLFYLLSKKKFDYRIALILTGICSFLYPVLYYGITGRGYTLVLLFFTIIYYLTTKILNSEDDRDTSASLFLFSICSILGFYTMPSFLYPFTTLYLFLGFWAIGNKRWVLLKKMIYWGIFTVACVVLLYLPVFIVSGVKSVTSNSYVHPIPRSLVLQNLLTHFTDTYKLLFSFNEAIIAAFIICIAASFNKTQRKLGLLNLWMIGFSLLIPILHSVIPFPRTWIYLLVPVLFSLGILSVVRVHAALLGAALLLLMSLIFKYNFDLLAKEEHFSTEEAGLCNFLLQNNITSVYVEEPLTDAYVLFAYGNAHKPVNCYINKDAANKPELSIYRKDKQAALAPAVPIFTNDIVAVYKNQY